MDRPLANTPRVLLVDASIYFFRAYYVQQGERFHPDGYEIDGAYGFVSWLLRLLVELKPRYIACAFDESLGTCFRNDIYAGYKASRPLPDDNIKLQFALAMQACDALGIANYASPRFEADDILATLAFQARQQGFVSSVISGDKDLAQIVLAEGDNLWDYPKKEALDRQGIYQKYGVYPEQFADWLALMGDKSDDVPGVPGVGAKTAAAMLQQSGSVQALYNDLAVIEISELRGAKKLAAKLAEYQALVATSLQLTTTSCTAELELDWSCIEYNGTSDDGPTFLNSNGMGSLMFRYNALVNPS